MHIGSILQLGMNMSVRLQFFILNVRTVPTVWSFFLPFSLNATFDHSETIFIHYSVRAVYGIIYWWE